MKSNHVRGFELKYLAVMSVLLCVAILAPRGPARSAWTPPTTPPPGGNVAAPLNTSGTPQTKQGNLTLGGDFLKMGLGSIYLANPDVLASPGIFWANTADTEEPHINFLGDKLYISAGITAGNQVEFQGKVNITNADGNTPALTVGNLLNCAGLKTNGSGTLECGSGGAGTSNWTQDNDYLFPIVGSSKVGIGDETPASRLTVGDGDKFQVNDAGNIVSIKGVPYSWPDINPGAGNWYLKNAGDGTLTWSAVAAGGGMWEAGVANNIHPVTPGTTQVTVGWDGATNDDTQLSVKNNSDDAAIYARQDSLVGGYAGYFSGKTVFMDGNVGIGTTNPSTKLEVWGGAIKATDGLIIQVVGADPGSPAIGQMWLVAP